MSAQYMCAAGVPDPCADHCAVLAEVALMCRDAVGQFEALGEPLKLKLGLHTGAIIGGVIGEKLPRYRCPRGCVSWGPHAWERVPRGVASRSYPMRASLTTPPFPFVPRTPTGCLGTP